MSSLPLKAPGELQTRLRAVSKSIHASVSPTIFRQGEPSRGVYLIESGRVKLSLCGEHDDAIFERSMGPGSLLGLPATINNLPYSATATVVESAELSFVSREDLLKVMMDDPAVAMTILKLLSQEIHAMRDVIRGGVKTAETGSR